MTGAKDARSIVCADKQAGRPTRIHVCVCVYGTPVRCVVWGHCDARAGWGHCLPAQAATAAGLTCTCATSARSSRLPMRPTARQPPPAVHML